MEDEPKRVVGVICAGRGCGQSLTHLDEELAKQLNCETKQYLENVLAEPGEQIKSNKKSKNWNKKYFYE